MVLALAMLLGFGSALGMQVNFYVNQPDSVEWTASAHDLMLPEVRIEAFNKTASLKTIPGSISARTKNDIANVSYPSILPLLNSIPGVHVHQGTFNTNRIVIRGIGARIPYTTGRIRVYFEEVPLTNGSGYSMAEYIDPVFVDQVLVIKSPASGAYGSGLGGTLLLRSKPPSEYYPSMLAEIQAGAWGLVNTTLALEEKRTNHSLRLAFSKGSMDGYRQNNQMQRQTAGLIWHVAPGTKHLLSFKMLAHELKAHIPSSIDSLTFFTNPRSAATNWLKTKGYEKGKRLFGSMAYAYLKGKTTPIKSSLFFNLSQESEVRPFDMFDEKRNLVGIKTMLNRKLSKGSISLEGSTGLEAFVETVHFKNRQNINGEGTPGNPISKTDEQIYSTGLFVQINTSYGPNQLNAGLSLQQTLVHYNNFSHITQKSLEGTYNSRWVLSPRLGINRSLSANQNLYFSINHGYSPPSLSETLNTEGTINPAIKPEKSLTWDAGWRISFPKFSTWIDLSAYFMHITDLLVAERIGDDVWVGRNAGKARHLGMEAEMKTLLFGTYEATVPSSKPIQQVQLHLNAQAGRYIFTEFIDRGADRSGNQIPGIPSVTMNITLQITAYNNLYLHPSLHYTGKMALNDGNTRYTDPYILLDLRTGWKKAVKKATFEVYLQANNLTNTHYASMILVNAPGQRNQRYYYPGLPLHLQGGAIFRLMR